MPSRRVRPSGFSRAAIAAWTVIVVAALVVGGVLGHTYLRGEVERDTVRMRTQADRELALILRGHRTDARVQLDVRRADWLRLEVPDASPALTRLPELHGPPGR